MTSKKNILKLLSKNAVEFYSMISRKKISINTFANLILNQNIEKLEKSISDYNDDISLYRKKYTKLDCIDSVLELNIEKYQHLKEIRNIVRMDTIVSKIIDDKTYEKALYSYYLNKLFLKIFKVKPELEIDYSILLQEENKNISRLIMEKIDNYYISIITK